MKLFFQAADRPGLVIEERAVPLAPELSRQVRAVVEELARGSRIGLQPTLSPATRVLEVFVTARAADVSGAPQGEALLTFETQQDPYTTCAVQPLSCTVSPKTVQCVGGP